MLDLGAISVILKEEAFVAAKDPDPITVLPDIAVER